MHASGNDDGHESAYSWEWLRSWRGSFRSNEDWKDEAIRQIRATEMLLPYADDKAREWSHVDPSRPDLFPVVSFEEIMNSDKGVANWTEKIVRSTSMRNLPQFYYLHFTIAS